MQQKTKATLALATALTLGTGLTAVAAADGFGAGAQAKAAAGDLIDTLFGKKAPKKINVQAKHPNITFFIIRIGRYN